MRPLYSKSISQTYVAMESFFRECLRSLPCHRIPSGEGGLAEILLHIKNQGPAGITGMGHPTQLVFLFYTTTFYFSPYFSNDHEGNPRYLIISLINISMCNSKREYKLFVFPVSTSFVVERKFMSAWKQACHCVLL